MKFRLMIIFLSSLLPFRTYAIKSKPQKDQFQIGAIYTAPIEFNKKLYFISADGVLFETDIFGNKARPLFKMMKKSISGIVESNGILYFGEGLHFDEITHFYAFDPKLKKNIFKFKVKGHIEKTPVIYNEMVIFSAGKAGLIALNKKTGKLIWNTKKMALGKKLHIDATPIIHNETIYVAAIYDNKGLLCFNVKTGRVTCYIKTKKDIKSDLVFKYPLIAGLATDANSSEKDRLRPSVLYTFDLNTKKIMKEHKLRGHNYFFSYLNQKTNYMFFGMSSGDVLRIHIKNQDLKYLDVFPEIFKSTAINIDGNDCLLSTRGIFICYGDDHKRKKLKKNFQRTSVGTNKIIKDMVYFPTRFGYLALKKEDLKY